MKQFHRDVNRIIELKMRLKMRQGTNSNFNASTSFKILKFNLGLGHLEGEECERKNEYPCSHLGSEKIPSSSKAGSDLFHKTHDFFNDF